MNNDMNQAFRVESELREIEAESRSSLLAAKVEYVNGEWSACLVVEQKRYRDGEWRTCLVVEQKQCRKHYRGISSLSLLDAIESAIIAYRMQVRS